MFKRILVPLDGSKLAEQIFPFVVEMAETFDSEVILAEVCEPEESEYGQACRLYINNEAEKLRRNLAGSAAKVTTAILSGKAAEQIVDYAEKNGINIFLRCHINDFNFNKIQETNRIKYFNAPSATLVIMSL